MYELQNQRVSCPYCGEAFEAVIDLSEGDSQYTEDCYVCCRPIVFCCRLEGNGNIVVTTLTENETF